MTRTGQDVVGGRGAPRGFTLLEVALALAISVLIVGAIAMAIDIHLRLLDNSRREIEEAQLARTLLRHIADDLRSALRYEPIDVASMLGSTGLPISADEAEAALNELGGSSADAAGAAAGGDTPPLPESASLDSEASTSSSTDLATSVVEGGIPGLYGDANALQVDISRLPRADQIAASLYEQPFGADLTSEVKTVTWYVGALGHDMATPAVGLIRRELDRSVAQWAMSNGDFARLDLHAELLAPEVVALEFRYFDGLQWLFDWQATEANPLPVAVEIILYLQAGADSVTTTNIIPGATLDSSGIIEQQLGGVNLYRLVVHLPAATPATPDDAEVADAL